MTNSKPYLIIGNGQVGSALLAKLGELTEQATRADLDLANASSDDYLDLLKKYQPKVVINTAAYTQVDKAEEEQKLAMQVNGAALAHLATACKEVDALLVHYSTDYVFDGAGQRPWKEGDETNPINYYGETKLAGEKAIQDACNKYLIFRISWVYDEEGSNFVNTMLRLGKERESLNIISDQTGAPCYASDIAEATLSITNAYLKDADSLISGIYHMCNGGETTWYDFALEIFNQANRFEPMLVRNIKAIPTSEYPTPAKRPHNSRMNCEKLRFTFDTSLPHWKDALTRCMEEKYARRRASA